jgi:hypothetical protein
VQGTSGTVSLRQVDRTTFRVDDTFRFSGEEALEDIERHLRTKCGDAEAAALLEAARVVTVDSPATDLASVPQFLGWFERPYGLHTLAAIIHDRLIIGGQPNKGALQSDILADRFFRQMMRTAGVSPIKRWVMWAAVALRTRWEAGTTRKLMVGLWAVAASIGIISLVSAIGTVVWEWPDLLWLSAGARLTIAAVLPIVSLPLWGRQYGAGLIAFLVAPFVLPPAAVVIVGYGLLQFADRAADGS